MEVPLFGVGLQGKSPNVTANKLVNAYYEFQSNQDRTQVAIYGTPGLTLFLNQGETPWRGLHSFKPTSKLYGVHRGTLYEINNAASVTSVGTLGTIEGKVSITDDGTNIVVVDGSEIYTYNTSTTTFATGSDVDRPTSPNTCVFHKGRVITDEALTGKFKGGGSYDPTAWDGLDFATAESHPDNIARVINYRGILVLFGDYTTEFWDNIGGSGFPYARIQGADLEVGLAARWSVGSFMSTYGFLARTKEGQVVVAALNGTNTTKISNTELDHEINSYSDVADATGFGYTLGGHPMYQLNFPTAGKSWLYDGSTQYWSELRYKGNQRHRAEFGVEFINQNIVSDYENGKLYKLDPDVYTDNGEEIHTIIRGRHIFNDKKMVKIARLELGLEAGTGLVSGQGVNPVAGLRLSKDGGHSWGTQTFSKMGKIGKYDHRCMWRRLGAARDIVPEITITDPVKRVITDSVLIVDEGS